MGKRKSTAFEKMLKNVSSGLPNGGEKEQSEVKEEVKIEKEHQDVKAKKKTQEVEVEKEQLEVKEKVKVEKKQQEVREEIKTSPQVKTSQKKRKVGKGKKALEDSNKVITVKMSRKHKDKLGFFKVYSKKKTFSDLLDDMIELYKKEHNIEFPDSYID